MIIWQQTAFYAIDVHAEDREVSFKLRSQVVARQNPSKYHWP